MILKNKVAVVTGGSGGIGRVVTGFLGREGAKVFVVGKETREIKRVAPGFVKDGLAVGFIRADVSKFSDAKSAVKLILSKSRKIDVLVNCAGIQAPIGPFLKNGLSEWLKNIGVNLLGTIFMTKLVLPQMAKRQSGSIINFSGGGSASSRPNFSAYAVAKTGVVRFTEVLADEVKKYGVRVNVVAPGAVNTKMLYEVIKAGKRAGSKEYKDVRERAQKGGTPPELAAELVLFLASSKSGGLTGKMISAPWDNWKQWKKKDIRAIMNSDRLTLRRIK